MKNDKTLLIKRFSPWAWLVFILSSTILVFMNYAGSEGLNPTDDGVILAQSWRILQGQIPHLDFVSIRPVGSGVLHTIHFALPFPLEMSARYFVLFQFFIVAFSWVQFFRLKSNFKHELPLVYQLSILLMAWIFGTYNYNLFSWTTIDAVFWSSLGFYFCERAFHTQRKWLGLAVGLFAFSMAGLSRQSFLIITAIGWLWTLLRLYHRKSWKNMIISAGIGISPFIIYALVILTHNAGKAFIIQITGETSFYDTAINTFWQGFKSHEIRWLTWGILLFSLIFGIIRRVSPKTRAFFAALPAIRMVFVLETGLVIYFFYRIFDYFLSQSLDIYSLPFIAFWILINMLALLISVQENRLRDCLPAWFALLVAWVSSISLGCNSPVFSFAILFVAIIWVYLKKYQDVILLKQTWIQIILPALTLILSIITIKSQFEVNYRDLGKSTHTHFLSEINPDYGRISTNEYTFKYLNEIDSLIKRYETDKGKICFVPDNAIIYPVYRLKNPLPLDWGQIGEMPLQELSEPLNMNDPYNKTVQWKLDERVIFFVQKVNVKTMSNGFEPLKEWKYPYLKILHEQATLIGETEFFKIYQK
jgi:hypothetical protein